MGSWVPFDVAGLFGRSRSARAAAKPLAPSLQDDPHYPQIRQAAETLLVPAAALDRAARLPVLKEFLKTQNEALAEAHRKGGAGLDVARIRTIIVDLLLENLFRFAVQAYEKAHGPLPIQVGLVALGGYGRAELCPFSDIDIMFLYPRKVKPKVLKPVQEVLTDEVLYPMWDLSLKVGHSTRSIQDALEEAKKDVQTKNALLEARFLCGSDNLFSVFQQAYKNFCRTDAPAEYIQERLNDQVGRRARYGDTVFLQEPDIKNGVGGLRDYQNILWMARIRLDAESLEDLVSRNYLRRNEQRELHSAYDFLLRVRNELHFQSTRPTDLLNLEKQPVVALNLGYRDEDIFRRVESFMKDYYSHAQAIYRMSKLIERRLAIGTPQNEAISIKAAIEARRYDRQKRMDGFVLIGQTLTFENTDVFKEDPVRLVRVFRHCQQYQATLDLELTLLIRDSLALLTPEVVTGQPGVNRSLVAILQAVGQVYPILREMHELGVLGRVLPEFDRLTCLVQHEYYHRYTADAHTLNTIQQLDAVFAGEGEFVEMYRSELRETTAPWLLYLILLLHDVGKAAGIHDHAESGAELAKAVLERLELDAKTQETVLFVIRNHLEMARFWQRYDVDDPRTSTTFSEFVGDPELLRFLYVHTFCDARGTALSLWNSYKDLLHNQLFQATLEILEHREVAKTKRQERKQAMLTRVLEMEGDGISREEVEAHFSLLPERYFVNNGAAEIRLHLRLINRLLTNISQADSLGSLIPVIDWRDDIDQGVTVVNIVTWDRAGLFYKLAGAFSVAGLNILGTKAISRSDHITIDTFYVTEPGGGISTNPKARELFQKGMEGALLHNQDLMPDILTQAKRHSRAAWARDPRLKAPIPPSVDVYHELSLRRTIIEVQANDQIGLLYQLSKAIFDHGFDITFARISTERGCALDTFYIENVNLADTNTTSSLIALRESLNKIIAVDRPAHAASL